MLSTSDLNSTDDKVYHITGQPLSTKLAGSIPAGLTIVSQTHVPATCNGVKMCEIIKAAFGQDSLFTIKTISKQDQVLFDISFENVSHDAPVAYKSIELSLKVSVFSFNTQGCDIRDLGGVIDLINSQISSNSNTRGCLSLRLLWSAIDLILNAHAFPFFILLISADQVVNGNMSYLDILPSVTFDATGYIHIADRNGIQEKKLPLTGMLEYSGIWAKLMGEFDVNQYWTQAFNIPYLALHNIHARCVLNE